METKIFARHGDMTILKVSSINPDLKSTDKKRLTIGLGETTGHSHEVISLDNSSITEYFDEDKNTDRDNIYFKVSGKAILMHEEHEPIILEEGLYVRTTQIQFNPFSNTISKIID